MSYGTRFTETEALLAMEQGDQDAARQLVLSMTPREAQDLGRACNGLEELAFAHARGKLEATIQNDGGDGA